MDESQPKESLEDVNREQVLLETLQPSDIKRLYEDHQRLLILYGFANTLSMTLDPEILLHETMNVLFGLAKAERGAIFLFDEKSQTLIPRLMRSRDKRDQRKEILLSHTIIREVLKERKGIFSLDAQTDPRFNGSKSIQIEKIRTCICVPMESPTHLVGVLYIDSRLKEEGLLKEDMALVSGLANQTAVALENADLVQRLHQERRRIEGILDGLTVGVVSIEQDGTLSFLNQKAEQLLCQKSHDVVGRAASLLFKDSPFVALCEFINEAQKRGAPVSQQEMTLSFHGVPHVWEVSIIPLRQLMEQRLVVLLDDVTEKRQLTREVARTEKLRAIGEMAAGLIHEINNPLNIVSGRIQLLLMKYREDPEIQKDGNIIRQQLDRASKITEKLLNFSKQHPPEFRRLDISRLLQDVFGTLESQLAASKVILSCHFSEKPCLIQGDPAQLEEVVVNLTLNAIQAMPQGGAFAVQCLQQDGQVIVSFRDTGVGIPKENLAKVFIPFFTTKPHGTGLGLPVIHGIVETHHGTLKLESAVGRGTTFFLTFPSAREES